MTTVLIAMSGGVDSAIAAWMMKQNGYNCHAATMKLSDHCNIEDARSIAEKLEMPFHVFDFSNEFRTRVVNRFVQTYLEGRTPNPCVECNRFLKFDMFLRKAQELGISRIATGHYAQIEYDPLGRRHHLKQAVDETKDQSYVLYTLTQTQLAQSVFPLGTMRKQEVRKIAESLGFVNAEKRESQDLCFVPDGDYATFIEQYTQQRSPPGDFVDKTGKVLGKHRGLIRYTIGQRKGLGIAAPAPYYVCEHHVEENTVVLGSEEDLQVQTLTATDINLIVVDRLANPIRAIVKVRYRQKGDWATASQIATDTLRIVFDEPQKGVAKGQAAVLYQGGDVIGGGTIATTD
ncbi:MAG: tRNA 2-thiouridine(34) synthase MnmA [Planctomycetaceae bacterium]|nr:tRNA 2-thiouridine(34) synthase MnmA [Planctomycetaceae bacterium]